MFRNINRVRRGDARSTFCDKRGGFTLVEVLIAASVSAVLTIGLLGFYLTTYKIGFVNQERNRINANMRALTADLVQDGRQSNYFILYKSTKNADRDNEKDWQLDGKSGDLLVFVYTEHLADNAFADPRIAKWVAYYRMDVDGDAGLSPVRRMERSYDPPSTSPLEALLPDEASFAQADEVVELSLGLADGRLFYNFWGRSVMVNGQIYHGNAAKRVTETYNFTISPRG